MCETDSLSTTPSSIFSMSFIAVYAEKATIKRVIVISNCYTMLGKTTTINIFCIMKQDDDLLFLRPKYSGEILMSLMSWSVLSQ